MDPFDNLKATKGHLDTCIQVCVQEHLILKDKFEKIQISSSKVIEERETLKANLNSVNERNRGLQKELISANEKNEELQKQFAASTKKNEELQKQFSGSQEKNADLQKELTESGSSLNEALNKNAELETSLNEARVEIKDVKSKLTLAQNNKLKLEKELHLARKNLSRVEKEKHKYKVMYENLHKQLQNMLGSMSKQAESGSEKAASESEEIILSSDDENVPRLFSNGVQCDDKSIVEIAESTPLVIDVRSPQSNSPLSPRRSNRTASRSPVSSDLVVSKDLSKSFVASTRDEAKNNQSCTNANQRDTRSIAHRSPISPISTRAIQGANRPASPVLIVDVQNRPNPTSSAISPKRDARGGSRSPISSILKSPGTPSKATFVSAEGISAGNTSSGSVTDAQNRPIPTSPVFSPRIMNVQSKPNHDRRSPISSILKTATPLSTEGTHGGDRSASPVAFASIQTRLNQTIVPVSPRKDNRDGRRSPISSTLITSSQNASTVPSASTGKEETNRPSTPSIVRVQSKPDQEKSVITPQKVHPVVNTATPESQSKTIPTTTNAVNKELNPPSPALIRSNLPVTSVSPRPEARHLRRSRSPITSSSNVSTDGNKQDNRTSSLSGAREDRSIIITTPVKDQRSTDPILSSPSIVSKASAVNKESNPPSPALIRSSNPPVTSVPPRPEARHLRRSRSPITSSSNVSTDGNKQDHRTSSSSGAQDDRSIITTTPVKDQRSTDPILNSPSVVPKASGSSGDKNSAVQSGFTADVRSTFAISSNNKTDLTSSAKKTSPVNAGKPSTPPVPPSSVNSEVRSHSPKKNESGKDEEYRPEELMPLLFPGLLNTPPKKKSTGVENMNTASSSVFVSDDDTESISTSSSQTSNTPSKFGTQFTAGLEFPKVCLTPIKVSEELLANISRLGKKNTNPSPEEGPSSKKRRKSVQSEPLRKLSPRKIKQKIMCLICKTENRCDDGFCTNRELDEHILKCHRKSNYLYDLYLRCPYKKGDCKSHFRLLKALREHVRINHRGETLSLHKMNRLLSCSNCDLLFRCKVDLNNHVFSEHIGSKKSNKSQSNSPQQNPVVRRPQIFKMKDLGNILR